MARPHEGSKDAANDKTSKKRTTVTTIETHEVWIIQGIPGLLDGNSHFKDSEPNALVPAPEFPDDAPIQKGEKRSK